MARESCFALKGGTAINLFVRDLPRLSVDIDLTYVPIERREKSLAHIDESLRRLGAAIEGILRDVTAVYRARGGERLTKPRVRRGREQVQIEVSPVLRGSVHAPASRDVSGAVAEQFGTIRMPHSHELYAGKLCAALDRQHPRDLFDVMQLQQAEGMSRELFDLFLVYMLSGDRPIAEMLAPRLAPLSRAFNADRRYARQRPTIAARSVARPSCRHLASLQWPASCDSARSGTAGALSYAFLFSLRLAAPGAGAIVCGSPARRGLRNCTTRACSGRGLQE